MFDLKPDKEGYDEESSMNPLKKARVPSKIRNLDETAK